ncbi:sulfur carrier protein [Atopomonas hussainii]|uniref:Sulfur carrier protein n=1 Tax=Atopomonas hussainii TaxID=1429083 RepID=A0A1H7IE32_9GAMM|nr:sulfur carrier protein ThiS [Atopomonas hussainii]SEK58885.1 sulfur carrier protein [Atopomonas hussainii]
MQITLNGQAHTLPAALSIAELLAQLGLTGKRVAVERNQEIVPRSAHASTVLAEGDHVEVVHAIGGG